MKLFLLLSFLVTASLTIAASNPPKRTVPGYRGPDMYKDIRIRVDADFPKSKSHSPKSTTLRLPWATVKRFPSPYDPDDDVENEYYYDELGFGQMSVLTTEYRFRGRKFVRSAHIPLSENFGESVNTVYESSDITCVFYIDRLGSEKYYSTNKKDRSSSSKERGNGNGNGNSNGNGEGEEETEEVRNWRPASEPFKLGKDVSVSVHVDGLKCWNWFEGIEWARQIEGSQEIWNTFVEEQIYGPEGRDPYYRIYGDQPGLRSYFN